MVVNGMEGEVCMICEYCGYDNAPSARVCAFCGVETSYHKDAGGQKAPGENPVYQEQDRPCKQTELTNGQNQPQSEKPAKTQEGLFENKTAVLLVAIGLFMINPLLGIIVFVIWYSKRKG